MGFQCPRKGKHSCSALKQINVCSHSFWHCVYLVWFATQHIFKKWRKWKVSCTPLPYCKHTEIFSERNKDDDVFGGGKFYQYHLPQKHHPMVAWHFISAVVTEAGWPHLWCALDKFTQIPIDSLKNSLCGPQAINSLTHWQIKSALKDVWYYQPFQLAVISVVSQTLRVPHNCCSLDVFFFFFPDCAQ